MSESLFWVRFTGSLVDAITGDTVDESAPHVDAYLKRVTALLITEDRCSDVATLLGADGELLLSAVFAAETRGQAIDAASEVFDLALTVAGGQTIDDDEDAASWLARELRLVREPELAVRVLATAA